MGREATLGYTSPDVRFRNDTEFPVTIKVSYTETQITVAIVGITTVVNVQSILTGSATTLDGGTVTIMRIITLDDGSTQSQMWTHTYRGLPPSDDDPPPPPPPDEDGGGGGPTPL
jgi:vancomycin resistance protein YoaR